MARNKDTDYNNNNNNHYNKFERKISRLFDDFLNDVGFTRTHGSKFRGVDDKNNPSWTPAIDIKEVEREYIVVADVPGVRKEDIDIEYHDSVLVLSGHLDQQDVYSSSSRAQEINVGKDNRDDRDDRDNRQKPSNSQYPQPQQYQQQPPQPYQQLTEPQPQQYQQNQQNQQYQQQQQQPPPQTYQQSAEPQKYQQQPPSDAQRYQQSVEQKYNLSNDQQQSNQPQQYQQRSNDPQYQQQSNDPQYQQRSNDPQYQQQSNDPQYQQQQSNDTQQFQHVNKHRNRQDASRGERFHIQERPYGYFSRSIQLPSNIRSDDEFYANLENGILKIRIPKNEDKPRRKISIR